MKAAVMVRVLGATLMVLALILTAGCGGDDEAAKAASDFVTAQTEFNSKAGTLDFRISTATTTNNMAGLSADTADSMAALETAAQDMRTAAGGLKDQPKNVAMEIAAEADTIISIFTAMIAAGEKGDVETFNAKVAEYDVAVESFNSLVDEWNALQTSS